MSGAAERTYRAAATTLLTLGATVLAVIECFLLPLRFGSVPVPLSIPVAVALNLWLPRVAHRTTGWRTSGVAVAVAWVVIAVVASMPRPEGDLIISSTWRGIGFLLLGALAAAYAVGRVLSRRY